MPGDILLLRFVRFREHKKNRTFLLGKPAKYLLVASEFGMPRVNQQPDRAEWTSFEEILLRYVGPRYPLGFRLLRVAIARHIYQIKSMIGHARAVNEIIIKSPRFSRSATRLCKLLTRRKRIDERRFSDIRPANQRDLRQAILGKGCDRGKAGNERGLEFHAQLNER